MDVTQLWVIWRIKIQHPPLPAFSPSQNLLIFLALQTSGKSPSFLTLAERVPLPSAFTRVERKPNNVNAANVCHTFYPLWNFPPPSEEATHALWPGNSGNLRRLSVE